MSPPEKLGGCKVLKHVTLISLAYRENTMGFPSGVFRSVAEERINLPYLTCVFDHRTWGCSIAVEAGHADRVQTLTGRIFEKRAVIRPDSAILSIFPHRKNPEITGALFEAFGREGLRISALASSPSAISMVLDGKFLNRASNALFGPFSFSAYRTPEEWKLAQEGKEELYREVVASFQEQKPRVYGLEYQDKQELLRVKLDSRKIGEFGACFREFARLGLNLTFLATGPGREKERVAFCLPLTEESPYKKVLERVSPGAGTDSFGPVATFAMNGPHFGDRYGIASELLDALDKGGVTLLGLSCTIASITGVVPSSLLKPAIEAIEECFDIPSVVERR